MFSQKTRVIIASIIIIAALALALRGRVIWDEITQWIAVHSLPLITSQSEVLEQPEQSIEQKAQAYDASEIIAEPLSSTTPIIDEIQIIPTTEIIQELRKIDVQLKKPRVARRRRKKETECIQKVELQQTIATIETEKIEEPLVAQPSTIVAEPAPTKAGEITAAITTESMLTKAAEIEAPKTIRICNKINPNALGVKHWTGTYTPTKLEITLNNVLFTIVGTHPVACEALHEIPCADNRITVFYHYEFLNGMRKGSDTIVYTIIDQPAQLEMKFSWDTPWHIELAGAQRVAH
jgi:hypothetical protein